jgi:hypothetical protein
MPSQTFKSRPELDGPASVVQDLNEPLLGLQENVQLTAMVSRRVRRAVQRYALEQGRTVRSVILHLIRDAGIIEIEDAELLDRRTQGQGARPTPAQKNHAARGSAEP